MKKIQIIGIIGQDAELTEHKGQHIISFHLAEKEKSKTEPGGFKTTWFNCTYWKPKGDAPTLAKMLTRGNQVHIDGVPSIQTHQNASGHFHAQMHVNVKEVQILSLSNKHEITEQSPIVNHQP